MTNPTGLAGTLIPIVNLTRPIDDHAHNFGCARNASIDDSTPHPKRWIALSRRGGCPFVEKARNAQRLGALALIVGDSAYNDGNRIPGGIFGTRRGLISMWGPRDTDDIHIPSVFVSSASYEELVRLYKDDDSLIAPAPADGDQHRNKQRMPGLSVILSRDEQYDWCALR